MLNPLARRLRQPYEDIVRLRRIAEVLLRNGLGFLVEQLDLTRFLPRWKHLQAAQISCMLAAVLALWLLFSLIRSRRF